MILNFTIVLFDGKCTTRQVLLILLITVGFVCYQPLNTVSPADVHINEFEDVLAAFKKNEKVRGLAFALFDNNDVIFQKCLGNSTYGYPINGETLFSIQSISKNITTLAVMKAVQDGLLDLDLSISNYLPGFKINSCFEDDPEERITIRMLLSNTAGFTHEAPVGNNYDFRPVLFHDHINSIADSWLKFPAGTNYSYSNLGFDLAAKIVEDVSGMVFNDYLKINIFDPLEMTFTTIHDDEVVRSLNKTEGTIPYIKTKHYKLPYLGAGAVYTSLGDLIKYVQLHMHFGELDKKSIIDRSNLNKMYTIGFFNYGLGTYIGKIDGIYFLNHNGGGYGYSSAMLWYPEYNVGAVMLCNSNCAAFDVSRAILNMYVENTSPAKDFSVTEIFDTYNGEYFSHSNQINAIERQYCSNDTLFIEDWRKYTGTYALVYEGLELKWYAKLATLAGYHPQKVFIEKEGQTLKIRTPQGESILRKYRPGLFFTNGGEAVSFTDDIPTYRNIKLKKIK